jgi:diguanylate cyclase (GGDEF)-like protein/PAS domain S-box-containing protein
MADRQTPRAEFLLTLAAMPFVLVSLIPSLRFSIAPAGFLPLHLLAETLTLLLSLLIFSIGWFNGSRQQASRITLLASLFLAVGLLDLAHLLSFPGMPDFVMPASQQQSTHFWMLSRQLGGLALLLAALLPWQSVWPARLRRPLLGVCLLLTALAYWAVFFHPDWLAPMDTAPFKTHANQVVIGLYLLAAGLLYHRLKQPQQQRVHDLFFAAALMLLSEWGFSLYAGATDALHLLSHAYKIAACLLIYRAVFIDSVREPLLRLRRSEAEAWRERERVEVTLDSLGEAVVTIDALGRIEYLNPAAEKMLGQSKAQARGKNFSDVLNIVNEPAHHMPPAERPDDSPSAFPQAGHLMLINAAGDEFYIEDSAAPMVNQEGDTIGAVLIYRDVSERRKYERQLAWQATHDSLTGLPNRALFRERLDQAILLARRTGQKGAILFVDLDNFKTINDTLGHSAGDILLKIVADRLRQDLRESDTVARFGGDEFVLLMHNCPQGHDFEEVARRLLSSIAEPYELNGQHIFTSASIGITTFPADPPELDAEALLRNADIAMYQVKERGRGGYRFFTLDMNAALKERLELSNGLRGAISHHEFTLHYQPKVSLQTDGAVCGMEALLRWRHPQRGFISPAIFIPIAEEYGLIGAIGQWVLNEACRQMRCWLDAGLSPPPIAINLSLEQCRTDNLASQIRQALRQHGLDGTHLQVEITESTVMRDTKAMIKLLQELREIGIRLAIDDFGTGYSSLAYLRRFPIDYLKIDKSFIDDVDVKANNGAIARAIIAMAHSLGMRVIAEGVETESQLAFLMGEACDEIQGYLFSKPLPADDIEALMRAGKRLRLPLACAAP